MNAREHLRLAVVGLALTIVASVLVAQAAPNTVSPSLVYDGVVQNPITANDLKPAECAALNLTNIVSGSGTFTGTGANDLVLGSASADTIDGLSGDDCILGGDQDDELSGGGGGGVGLVRDEFNNPSYSGNDGTQSWSNSWQETGESDGAILGDVQVEPSFPDTTYTVSADQDSYLEEDSPDGNRGGEVELPVQLKVAEELRSVFRFDLSSIPGGSTVTSATAYFWVKTPSSFPVDLHRTTDTWTEGGVTWNNTAADYDSSKDAVFTPSTGGFVAVDIAGLAQEWVDGTSPNYGLMLIGTTVNESSKFSSREEAGKEPYLEVVTGPFPGSEALRIQNAGKGAWREADLSGAGSAILSFDYRREGLDDAADYVAVEVSNDGGAMWTELDRFTGPATDGAMIAVSYDISSYAGANTAIRFISSASLGLDDKVYFDNVQIDASGGGSPDGNDVLLGGPGNDTLSGGTDTDACTGGPGSDIYDPSCEVQN